MKIVISWLLVLVNFTHWINWSSNRALELHATTFEKIGNFFLINGLFLLSIITVKGFSDLKILPNIKNPKYLRVYKKQARLRILFLSIGIFYIIVGVILPLCFERNVFFIPHNSEYSLLLFANAYYIINHYRKIKF